MNLLAYLALAVQLASPTPAPTDSLRIRVAPAQVYIESRTSQHLDLDLLVENGTADTLELEKLQLSVLDRQGRLVLRRFIRGPSMSAMLPSRRFAPGATGMVFNPFHSFDAEIELATLRYELEFSRAGSAARRMAETTVRPTVYRPRTDLILPVAGRLIADDGHDFFSHHRRFEYLQPFVQALGVGTNFERYALDLCVVDSAGALHRGAGSAIGDWFGLGRTVRAPGAGRVVATHNDQRDNDSTGRETYFDPSKIPGDNLSLYGNYVVIDHLNGEFSIVGHLRQGSVTAKVGDAVRQGDPIALVGSSGSSLYPHVHYELRTGSGLKVEGLPAYFRGVRRLLGSRTLSPRLWLVDTGDIVESR
jgi:murein DD-endopeptidase MepM/ murein hydrolase activator NlpD